MAGYYNLACLPESSESNRRGAGRPGWFYKDPAPLEQAPDVLPGRYLLAYHRRNPDDTFSEVSRTEIILMLPSATLPSAQPPPRPAPPSAAETSDPTLAAIRGALETAGIASEMRAGSFADSRELVQTLLLINEKERARSAEKDDRIDRLVNEKMALVDVVIGKFNVLSEHMAKVPPPPQEMPYISVVRELMSGFGAAVEKLAPGINAKLGAVQAQPALPAASSTAPAGEAPPGADPPPPPAASPPHPAPPPVQAAPVQAAQPPAEPAPPPPAPPVEPLPPGVTVETDPLPEDALRDLLAELAPDELEAMRQRLRDPKYRAQLLRPEVQAQPKSNKKRKGAAHA